MLELPRCDADSFQIFLDDFSKIKPNELKLIVLDNGAFHKAKKLIIPENIILIFLPPYAPELNPAEKIWQKFKRNFTNRLFSTLENLRDYVCSLAKELAKQEVISICKYEYVFVDDYWANV